MKKFPRNSLTFCALFLFIGAIVVPTYKAEAKSVQWPGTINALLYSTIVYNNGVTREGVPLMRNPNIQITYRANVKNLNTGAYLSDGATIPVGTQIQFEPDQFANIDIAWFASGYHYDTPYGYWVTNAVVPYGIECRDEDYIGTVIPETSLSRWSNEPDFYNLYSPFSVNPPSVLVSQSGAAGLSCNGTGTTCTITSPGTISSNVNFSNTYGKFYERTLKTPTYYGAVPVCSGSSNPLRWEIGYTNTWIDTLQIPAQTIPFTFTATAAPNTVNLPVIDGTTVGTTDTSYTFGFKATDKENDTVRYDISWNNNGTVNLQLPASGYTPSGTRLTATKTWPTTGTFTFSARTVDSKNSPSAWVTHTIVISASPNTVNPPVIDGPITGFTNTRYTFGFKATDNEGDGIRYGVDWNYDGVVEDQLPSSSTFTPNGTRLPSTNLWPTPGVYKIRAWALDSKYALSSPTEYTITITALPQPDLIGTLNSFAPVVAQTNVTFQGNVKNIGDANAGASTARFQIDMDNNDIWTDVGDRQNIGSRAVGVLIPQANSGLLTSDSWAVVTGTHKVRICADVDNVVAELNDGYVLNCSTPVTFTVVLQPDLATTFTPSPPYYTGTPVTFQGFVTNVGLVTAGNFITRFAIDIDDNGSFTDAVDESDQGSTSITSLNINANTPTLFSSSWPAVVGTHHARLCGDFTNLIAEPNESNNCHSGLFLVKDVPAPTFTCIAPGTSGTVTWTGLIPGSTHMVELDDTSSVVCSVGDNCPGTQFPFSQNSTTFSGLTAGHNYRARIKGCTINALGVSVCSTPSPYSATVTCNGLPDLISTINPVGTVTIGTPVLFTGNIKNNGTAGAGVSSRGLFQIDMNNNNIWNDAGIDIIDQGHPGISALGAGVTSGNLSSSAWDPVVGTHKVRLCADEPANVVNEGANEGNNCSTAVTFTVTGKPDLTATIVNPGAKTTGSSVIFQGTVRNFAPATLAAPASNGRFQINLNSAVPAVWTPVSNLSVIPLGIGVGTIPINAPTAWTAVLGTHQVRLCADEPADAIDELDDTNNCSSAVTFTVSNTPPAFTVSCSPSPVSVVQGDPISSTPSMTWIATPVPATPTPPGSSYVYTWDIIPECSGSWSSTKNCSYTSIGQYDMNVTGYIYSSTGVVIGTPVSASCSSSFQVTPAPPPITIDFNVVDSDGGGHNVDVGGKVDITWTIGGTPDSCTASTNPVVGGWDGVLDSSQKSNGSHTKDNIGPLDSIGQYIFRIKCSKGGAPDKSETVLIDVRNPIICGNGVKEGSEACDDGNSDNNDTCTNSCTSGPNTSGPCHITTICEPLRGETPLNCAECRGIIIEQ